MKFITIIGLVAALAGISEASRGSVKLLPWIEEGCHQAGRHSKARKIKLGECESDFDGGFRSFQLEPYHHTQKLSSGCHVEIFDTAGCMGRKSTSLSAMDSPNVCNNATFAINEGGFHSGRSAKLVCDKNPPPSKDPESTLVEVPFLRTTKVETKTLISTLKPALPTVSSISIVHIIDSDDSDDSADDVLTTTKTRGQVVHLATPSNKKTSSYSSTSTVWIQPEPTSTLTKVVISPAAKKSHTLTFTTFFPQGKPSPA